MKHLSHFDGRGKARMVDVSPKSQTQREAVAQARVLISPSTQKLILENKIIKGDVLTVAKIAGIMAAKKVASLIPMAHPLNITHCQINFDFFKDGITIEATTRIKARTGVEMEALTAVSVAALTIYDMCKAVQRDMVITDICLLKKKGGASGLYLRKSG